MEYAQYPGRGLRAGSRNEILQGNAAQVFHGVVQGTLGRLTEIVDRDRVGVRQAAGDLHLVLEASLGGFAAGAAPAESTAGACRPGPPT